MGSALRGAFGYALKKVVCMNPSFKCDGCFVRSDRLYYDFYEKKDAYHKYRFDISLELYEYQKITIFFIYLY